MKNPKLRSNNKFVITNNVFNNNILYPLNEIPYNIIRSICGYFVYLIYIGNKDIKGNDWEHAFASAINGIHLDSPISIADVVLGNNCWSMKTVKCKIPFNTKSIRLISGRCSPDYSYCITDPYDNIQKTGEAILSIWNERIKIAYDKYNQVRTLVLIRSFDLKKFVVFEEQTKQFFINDYHWILNNNNNLIGLDSNNLPCFTWQPHGSQFTIHTIVPKKTVKFCLKSPNTYLNTEKVLKSLKFDGSWITLV